MPEDPIPSQSSLVRRVPRADWMDVTDLPDFPHQFAACTGNDAAVCVIPGPLFALWEEESRLTSTLPVHQSIEKQDRSSEHDDGFLLKFSKSSQISHASRFFPGCLGGR
jgi:hypothetical protein